MAAAAGRRLEARRTVKHGALWLDTDDQVGAELVGEYYDAKVDLLGAVLTKRSLFVVLVYEKVQEPGWSLPHWAVRGPQNWFPTLEEATNYMIDAVRTARDVGGKGP